MGFNDGRCGACGSRMGWTGAVLDKPKCPKCGHKPTTEELEELEEVEKKLQAMEDEMLKD